MNTSEQKLAAEPAHSARKYAYTDALPGYAVYRAIATFVGLLAIAVPITFALSWITFRLIEKPMIDYGRALWKG